MNKMEEIIVGFENNELRDYLRALTQFHSKDSLVIVCHGKEYGSVAAQFLLRHNVNVDYLVDILSYRIYKPDDSVEWLDEDSFIKLKNKKLILSSHHHHIHSIINKVCRLGCGYLMLPSSRNLDGGGFSIAQMAFVLKHREEHIRAYDLFEEESKPLFASMVKYRLSRNYFDLLKISDNFDCDSYYDYPFFTYSGDEVYVDAGGFDGQSSIEFENFLKGIYRKIYIFEPLGDSYRTIIDRLENRKEFMHPQRIEVVNSAIENFNGTASFHKNGTGSRLLKSGAEKVSVVRLDDYPFKEKVSFIKMDVERAEINALHGAANLIRENRPKLAICAYHKPNDLWEIPILIKNICPEYKLYFRHPHPADTLETVCYATV